MTKCPCYWELSFQEWCWCHWENSPEWRVSWSVERFARWGWWADMWAPPRHSPAERTHVALGTALLSPQPPRLLWPQHPTFLQDSALSHHSHLAPFFLPLFTGASLWQFSRGTELDMGLRPTWVLVAGLLLEDPEHS